MATIPVKQWSNPVSNSHAYARAGKRRHRILQLQMEKRDRQQRLLTFCVERNYPFMMRSAKKLHLEFLAYRRATNPDYYVSYYTIFYDLREIFGNDYMDVYRTSANVYEYDYPLDILNKVKEAIEFIHGQNLDQSDQ